MSSSTSARCHGATGTRSASAERFDPDMIAPVLQNHALRSLPLPGNAGSINCQSITMVSLCVYLHRGPHKTLQFDRHKGIPWAWLLGFRLERPHHQTPEGNDTTTDGMLRSEAVTGGRSFTDVQAWLCFCCPALRWPTKREDTPSLLHFPFFT